MTLLRLGVVLLAFLVCATGIRDAATPEAVGGYVAIFGALAWFVGFLSEEAKR